MRIALDAHAVGRKQTGNETYIRNLLREFGGLDTRHHYVAYISAPSAGSDIPARFEVRQVSQNPWKRLGADLPAAIVRDRPDVLHVQYTAPLRSGIPVVATVHDVSFLEHPEFFSLFRRTQLKLTVARTMRTAARIIAPSDFSRQRIANAYPSAAGRISVIHNGVDATFRPMGEEITRRWVKDNYGLSAPYILTVGDLQLRKNQIGLIQAFAAMLRERPELPHHLVLAGKETFHGCDVMEAARQSGFADRILFPGFVAEDDLRHLYCGCDFFVFPSFYEGFGLPILEAMACGRAVACSDNSATAEVADGAAILFNPRDVPQITRALLDLAMHPELRRSRGALGIRRAKEFSWRKAATETLAVYQAVLSQRAQRVGVGV